MKTKAIRHHHINRIKQKRQQDNMYGNVDNKQDLIKSKYFKMRLNTPKLCSCYICGNPRKFFKNAKQAKTLQELKAMNDENF